VYPCWMREEKQKQMLKLFGEFRGELDLRKQIDIECKRNTDNIDLFETMIREAYPDTTLVVSGHHIMFVREGQSLPYEIASADTLIFDHYIAQKIWKDRYREVLAQLAVEPIETRDAVLRSLFFAR